MQDYWKPEFVSDMFYPSQMSWAQLTKLTSNLTLYTPFILKCLSSFNLFFTLKNHKYLKTEKVLSLHVAE
jgi:hypothetical protein